MISVSVVIPTHNHAHLLGRALSSVAAQDYSRLDLVVVDDGSTDATRELVRHFERKMGTRLKYVYQANLGPSLARNNGLTHCIGEYVIFLDADDELLEGAVETVAKSAAAFDRPGLLAWNYISNRSDGSTLTRSRKPFAPRKSDRFLGYLSGEFSLRPSTVAFHRSVFDVLEFPPQTRHGEDQVVFALVLATRRCELIDEPLTRVFRYSDSLGMNVSLALSEGFQVVGQVFDSSLLPESYRKWRRRFKAKRSLSLFRHCSRHKLRKKALSYFLLALVLEPLQATRTRNIRKLSEVLGLRASWRDHVNHE